MINKIIADGIDNTWKLLKELDRQKLFDIIKIIETTVNSNGKIFISGNGGSASTASHFAEDLVLAGNVSAISLSENISMITAISNDSDYSEIFKRQLLKFYNPNDVLIVISASGNSENLIKAVDYVNEVDGITIGLLGFDGGQLKSKCKYAITIKSDIDKYEEVENVHLILTHIITSYFKGPKTKC